MTHKQVVSMVCIGNVYDLGRYKHLRAISRVKPESKQENRSKFLTDRERVAKNRKPITFGGR